MNRIEDYDWDAAYAAARPARRFHWWDLTLGEWDHPYNDTVLNERAIEVPIAAEFLRRQSRRGVGPDGVEVGNVLSHYGWAGHHRVVDRYEPDHGAEPLDVFKLAGPFPWVLSISTVEHVRYDPPEPLDPDGAVAAVAHLVSCLTPGGQALITFPLGHNPGLDAAALAGALGATRACTFVRCGRDWVQTPTLEARPYGSLDPWAAAVFVGEWS